jgi:hypothetical protein
VTVYAGDRNGSRTGPAEARIESEGGLVVAFCAAVAAERAAKCSGFDIALLLVYPSRVRAGPARLSLPNPARIER